jgi:hypothetical protein
MGIEGKGDEKGDVWGAWMGMEGKGDCREGKMEKGWRTQRRERREE